MTYLVHILHNTYLLHDNYILRNST